MERPARHLIPNPFDPRTGEESERGAQQPDRRTRLVVGIGAAVLAAVVFVAIPFVVPDHVDEGSQLPSPERVEIGSAPSSGWVAMQSVDSDERAGFPTPVARVGGDICVGFARVDFGPDDLRPSLARCVSVSSDPLPAGAIRHLVGVKSGLDTWHFVEADSPVDALRLWSVDGEVDRSRLHLAGAIIGLRLENDIAIDAVEWTTRSGDFRCVPATDAWQTGRFCPTR